jgi:lipoprotein signal peptidase
MEKRQRFWWWLATAVLFLLGLFLVWRVNHRGWLLVALGTVYLGALYAILDDRDRPYYEHRMAA